VNFVDTRPCAVRCHRDPFVGHHRHLISPHPRSGSRQPDEGGDPPRGGRGRAALAVDGRVPAALASSCALGIPRPVLFGVVAVKLFYVALIVTIDRTSVAVGTLLL